MVSITIKLKSFEGLVKRLLRWTLKGYTISVDTATTEVTSKYKKQIIAGVDGKNQPMRKVHLTTMDMPIRFGSDKSIRKEVNSSRKPLVARGNAVRSLKKRKVNKDVTEIYPSTQHAKTVFGYNASTGKANKKRDPLIVSDVQFKILEKHLLKGLTKAIKG